MKVYPFKVATDTKSDEVLNVLKAINETNPLSQRIQNIYDQRYRVDFVHQDKDGLWTLDFVKFREGAGPGKTHPDRMTEGFDFDDDECFGEEAAALYNPKNNHFYIQYNHHGSRHTIITEYLKNYAPGLPNLKLLPIFDSDTESKYRSTGLFRKLEFTISAKTLSLEDRHQGRSLNSALDFGRSHGGERISVSISSGRSNDCCLSLQNVRHTVNTIQGLIGSEQYKVEKLEVSRREKEGFPSELLDFLGQRLCLEYEVEPGPDKRLPFELRRSFLKSACIEWADVLGG